MVTRRAGNDSTTLLFLGQVGELVVGTTDLEGEDILEILALEIDLVLGAGGEVDSVSERGLFEDLVAAGG